MSLVSKKHILVAVTAVAIFAVAATLFPGARKTIVNPVKLQYVKYRLSAIETGATDNEVRERLARIPFVQVKEIDGQYVCTLELHQQTNKYGGETGVTYEWKYQIDDTLKLEKISENFWSWMKDQ